MGTYAKPVNYRAIADELENAAQCLRERRDSDRADRLCKLAMQIRQEQRLPAGFRQNDL
jgi:hypothetical protein